MTETIGNIGNQIQVCSLWATKESIDSCDNGLDDINILPLVEATNVVCFCNSSIVEDGVDSACMIHYIQPVTNILALTIDREGFAMADVIYEEGNELLWGTGKEYSCWSNWSLWLACRRCREKHERNGQKIPLDAE